MKNAVSEHTIQTCLPQSIYGISKTKNWVFKSVTDKDINQWKIVVPVKETTSLKANIIVSLIIHPLVRKD